jgi:hypothetical protein
LLADLLAEARPEAPAAKWEFHYLPQLPGYGLKQSEFEKLIRETEGDGWEFVGVVTMKWQTTVGGEPKGKDGLTLPTLVFRRPARAAGGESADQAKRRSEENQMQFLNTLEYQVPIYPHQAQQKKRRNADAAADAALLDRQARAAQLEEQIRSLQLELNRLRDATRKQVTIPAPETGLEPTEMMTFLDKLAARRFGADARKRLALSSDSRGLTVAGDAEAVDWAVETVKRLNAK